MNAFPGTDRKMVLAIGTDRDAVRAELGMPVASSEENGRPCDIFSYVDGYSSWAKVARVTFHSVADTMTLFLWSKLVGNRMEDIASGNELQQKICYEQGKVITVADLKKE